MTQPKDERENQVRQLSLPLHEDPDKDPVPEELSGAGKPARRPKQGFMRVMRDSDVARSYSDNVALGYAVARGLAEVLAAMPPADLAALRARVAKSAEQVSRKKPRKDVALEGGL